MAAVTELSRIKVEDLEACKRALAAISDPEAKFKAFDELTNTALNSTAFKVLKQLAVDPQFKNDVNRSHVSTVLTTVDNCKKLSEEVMASLGTDGKNRLCSICPKIDTYIDTKIFRVLHSIVESKNSSDVVHPNRPLISLSKKMVKFQSNYHGNNCACYARIQAQLTEKVIEPSSLPSAATRITVKYDAGFGNKLFIRGEGPGLSWNKGIELKNIGGDTWVFETQNDFSSLKYKIVLNDSGTGYEKGDNRTIDCHKKEEIRPNF